MLHHSKRISSNQVLPIHCKIHKSKWSVFVKPLLQAPFGNAFTGLLLNVCTGNSKIGMANFNVAQTLLISDRFSELNQKSVTIVDNAYTQHRSVSPSSLTIKRKVPRHCPFVLIRIFCSNYWLLFFRSFTLWYWFKKFIYVYKIQNDGRQGFILRIQSDWIEFDFIL